MILLREIREEDLEAIERLAQIPGFISLPNDRETIGEKIARSVASFGGRMADGSQAEYLFVAEDLESSRVMGTAMVAARHGTAESPHFYFEVGSEKKFSNSINTGFIHGTLTLRCDTDGPTEIGGLVVDRQHRDSEARLGRQISFVRFLFIGIHRERFKTRILAELLPPLNRRGQSPLWEAIGRRFTNMDYWEADRLCRRDKEFIFSLFPWEKVYTTFLSAEARNAIGKVGKETQPVLHMLRKIGFEYRGHVDPFDGGPHLWAEVDRVAPIAKMGTYVFDAAGALTREGGAARSEIGLLCKAAQDPGQFRAMAVEARLEGRGLALAGPGGAQAARALGLRAEDRVVFMPYY